MIRSVAKDSEYARKSQALLINISAAKSIAGILKTNLGPRGTLKMLVGGAGDIRLTKDGMVLLSDMHIQHPTAALIARAATAQDDITGDGTTSIVLLVGEILSVSERLLAEGAHPSTLVEGILKAKKESMIWMKLYAREMQKRYIKRIDDEVLLNVAKTSLRTKLKQDMADKLAKYLVQAVTCIHTPGKQIDLHMIERMHIEHKMGSDTEFVKGLVLDHGPRNENMKRDIHNCYILTCNVSLEYDKTEVKTKWTFDSAQKRREFTEAERSLINEKLKKIVELKKKVCGDDKTKNFVVINQKGIDPISLEVLARNGITALRRAKLRNMARIPLACGGVSVNSFEDLNEDVLGWAEHVYEITVGEDKYTYVKAGDKHPKNHKCKSCTILFKGPNKHTIAQIKDASRDGLRAIKNCLEAGFILPGAGAIEVKLSQHLKEYAKREKGRARLGIQCFAEALLVIPKTLAQNSGLDTQDCMINLINDAREKDKIPGLDIYTGKTLNPIEKGIFDNLVVKEQMIESSVYTATQLLYVDEILKAGRKRK